jgi:3-oxoacyl-[acyl-carrier-protein] synthase-3
MPLRSVITGSGCYVPTVVKTNKDFSLQDFYSEDHTKIETPSEEIVDKFKQITGIYERRYASPELNASEIGTYAAQKAIDDSGVDPETIDQIIVAQNFGNVIKNTIQTDNVPSIASRIKHALGIKNPSCIAYDLLFGCPGWVQGIIHADAFFKAGIAKKCLVIGTETLSRVIDMYDRDSMIFSDGAGAVIVEAKDVDENGSGILSTAMQTHATEEAYYIYLGKSNFPDSDSKIRYIKMKGRKVYEYAIKHVPVAMKECLDKSGIDINDLKKIFIHQANEKMDESIVHIMYKLYGRKTPEHIMPMNIHEFGNSSVATVPTLFDLVKRGNIDNHQLETGDVILFASVGAGMNINAITYRI